MVIVESIEDVERSARRDAVLCVGRGWVFDPVLEVIDEDIRHAPFTAAERLSMVRTMAAQLAQDPRKTPVLRTGWRAACARWLRRWSATIDATLFSLMAAGALRWWVFALCIPFLALALLRDWRAMRVRAEGRRALALDLFGIVLDMVTWERVSLWPDTFRARAWLAAERSAVDRHTTADGVQPESRAEMRVRLSRELLAAADTVEAALAQEKALASSRGGAPAEAVGA